VVLLSSLLYDMKQERKLMRALNLKIVVTDNNEVTSCLPADFPKGEAELIVLAPTEPATTENADWLEQWISSLPPTPTVPTEAFDREEIYW
jgi:hypothetical protein